MKKKLSISVIILLAVVLCIFFYFKGRRYEVVIPQEKIDTMLALTFPASKEYLYIFSITFSNPVVTLLEDNDRVQVGLDATLNIKINDEPRNLGGGATVTSGIRYDNETQNFYLDDAVFDRLEIQGVPEKWLETVTLVASTEARNFVESQPIYRLEARDAKTATAKLLLKDFDVRDQAVYITLGL